MNPDTSEFRLWGFDGELAGNESLLQRRLPLFVRDSEPDAVYAARVLDWSPLLPDSDVYRVPVERAAEYGQPLEIKTHFDFTGRDSTGHSIVFIGPSITVNPGDFVQIVGPELLANLRRLCVWWLGVPAQEGFMVSVATAAGAATFAEDLEKKARRVFDREIAEGVPTAGARAALAVMRNIGAGKLRDHLIRTLALHQLEGDTDQFRRVLRLSEARLGETPERLQRDVEVQIAFARAWREIDATKRLHKGFTFNPLPGNAQLGEPDFKKFTFHEISPTVHEEPLKILNRSLDVSGARLSRTVDPTKWILEE